MESDPTSGGVPLRVLSEYLDGYLRVAEVPDYPTALNGLQVENAYKQAGRYPVTLSVVDTKGETAAQTFTVEVTE